ncbi:hypothetical protein GB937_002356 [Aspergillus fischeri]|nr:hypothetical protein GB937_002356 [Aspergillus fischeri]
MSAEKKQEQKATAWLKLLTSRSPEIMFMRLPRSIVLVTQTYTAWDPEPQHEMDDLVRIKMDRCNEHKESFNNRYPIDKLLEL